LIEFHLANPDKLFRIVTDVGPFKRLLCEIPLTIIELLGPDFSAQGSIHDDKSILRSREPGEIALKGYDTFNSQYYFDSFFPKPPRELIPRVLDLFEKSLPPYIGMLPTYPVLLIQRSQDKYYDKGCRDRATVYQTSGSQRRSITNHDELVDALSMKFGTSFSNIVLEQSSVYYQYYMFSRAKIVIAQHGASLANIFFMTKSDETQCIACDGNRLQVAVGEEDATTGACGPHVIEISPPWSREFAHFRNLANYCRVSHESIEQVEDHSEVDVGLVMRAVEKSAQKQGISLAT
jgi:hypothetical protein